MSLADRGDPIVAIATASGRGAVGIVRASGADLSPLIAAVCGRASLAPRVATLLPFIGGAGEVLDRGLALHFPAPASYTGEDVLELHAHGGPVLLQLLLLRCLQALPGARPARPGEFTERAFLNDKIDLAQAEAVADLIDASTEAAARAAARSLSGAFSVEVAQLAERLVALRALVEATLDFPDDEIDFLERAGATAQLVAIEATLAEASARARQGALLRDGLQLVLAGQPNAGKSSLLNALAGADVAIVTDVPGTTRDRIACTVQIEGVPLHLSDTAGLRFDDTAGGTGAGTSAETGTIDAVERIGIARSWEAIEAADAVLFLHDLSRRGERGYDADDALIRARLPAAVPVLDIDNKADLAPAGRSDEPGRLRISATTGAGLPALRTELLRLAGWQSLPDGVFAARTRHVQALAATRAHVRAAAAHLHDGVLELLAEELRLAHQALVEITGAFSNEDLLGAIFGRFCIGK